MNSNKNNNENNEVSREELIKTFELLFEQGLIDKTELQNAISLANEKYKSINQIKIDITTYM